MTEQYITYGILVVLGALLGSYAAATVWRLRAKQLTYDEAQGEKVSAAVSEYLGIESGKTTADGLFTLEKVACLGCCSLAPVIMINGEAFGNLTPEKAVGILKNLREKEGA